SPAEATSTACWMCLHGLLLLQLGLSTPDGDTYLVVPPAAAAASTNTLSESSPMAASIAEGATGIHAASLPLLFCCGRWSRRDRGRFCELGVEQEQQRFVVRERHPAGLPGVTLNLCGESHVVGGPGDESAVAGERLVHDSLATEARNGRLGSA